MGRDIITALNDVLKYTTNSKVCKWMLLNITYEYYLLKNLFLDTAKINTNSFLDHICRK